jgi:tetratricopeptide (TPR) repeat protein
VRALDRLAALELREFRVTHAAETLASAGASVQRALAIDPDDFDARRFRASIELTNHDFATVEKEATALSAERPWDVDVLGMVADARMESGKYAEAIATIQRMVDIRPGLPSYSRVAYAREIHGDLPGALAAMDLAIAAGDPADPEGISWCVARSGLLLWKLGRVDEAASRFGEARRLFPRSPHAWEGLGLVASARGNREEAAADFEKAFSIVPWPQYAVERAETARALERQEDARRWEAIVRAIERLSTEAGLFNRVLALFEADHGSPARGVAMASAELAVRQDVYGWDAYAWTLYRDGRFSEAAEAERHALERGTQDPMLDAHAGIIFGAAGEREPARLHLSRALAVNPGFDVARAADAREALSRLADSTRSSAGGGR